jgi:hypothetical protein
MKKRLAFWWIAANTLAWAIVFGAEFPWRGLWGWMVCGAIVGTAQWLALHRSLRVPPWWIAGTCFAWTVGIWAGHPYVEFIKVDFAHPLWAFITGGTLSGLTQSCFLWRRVLRPALWALSTLVASTVGWLAPGYVSSWFHFSVSSMSVAFFVGGAIIGAVIGAASTPQLLAMLRHPEPRQAAV